jgi:hypothetical protein
VHEADEPNALVDVFDSNPLTGQHARDVDLLAVQAETSAGGDNNNGFAAARRSVSNLPK